MKNLRLFVPQLTMGTDFKDVILLTVGYCILFVRRFLFSVLSFRCAPSIYSYKAPHFSSYYK